MFCCASPVFFFFLITNWKFVASLQRASPWCPFSNSICSLHVFVSHLDNFHSISDFSEWEFPCSPVGEESACNAGDLGSIPLWEDPLEKEIAAHSVFFPGESHGRRILAGYSQWGSQELDPTDRLNHHH